MKENGIGGANTKTGLVFETQTDIETLLASHIGYKCIKNNRGWVDVLFQEELVASIFKKAALYRFLSYRGVDWKKILSKKLLPDNSLYVICNNTFFVLECKFQKVAGSVDEKLQTCDFKKKQYKKLLAQLYMDVEYIYVLSDWFRKPEYKDVLDYIVSVGCSYYFKYVPLKRFGLPVPNEE